ncbi:MAG: hypothetical protein [Caudoviricetes sp.]|nr:MAG: hypothetical protein [Caudoviricetes sp.]
MERLQVSRAIDMNLFNAVGMYNLDYPLSSCRNIPADEVSNTSKDCIVIVFSHNLVSTVKTQILCVPSLDGYRKYERTLTSNTGAVNYNGGSSGSPWKRVYYVGDNIGSDFIPNTTNKYTLGKSTSTWANIYTQNAVTVVSDRNAKNSIQAIDDKVLDAWAEVEQKQYKLNGDDNWSFGYIAQDIVDAFTRHGLDYKQYNIVHEENGKFMLKYDMCAVLDGALTRKKLKV